MLKSLELKLEKPELEITNRIQMELTKCSRINEVEWVKKYSPEFRGLFNENRDQFLKLYKENPSEFYALLEMVLGRKN